MSPTSAVSCDFDDTPHLPSPFSTTTISPGKSNKVRDHRALELRVGLGMPYFGINALEPLKSKRPLVPEDVKN